MAGFVGFIAAANVDNLGAAPWKMFPDIGSGLSAPEVRDATPTLREQEEAAS